MRSSLNEQRERFIAAPPSSWSTEQDVKVREKNAASSTSVAAVNVMERDCTVAPLV